jgi:hypothetical protein
MTEVAFALIIGFVLGLLVGYLVRNEARRYEVDFGDRDEAHH